MTRANDDFTLDFAILLHSHSAQLSNVLEWIETPLEYLGRTPFSADTEPTPSDLEQALQMPVKRLLTSLRQYLRNPTMSTGLASQPNNIDVLQDVADILAEYIRTNASKRVRAPFLYEQVEQLVQVYLESSEEQLAEKKFTAVYQDAQRIQRIICIYNLIVAEFTIHEMRHQVNALHGFYSKDIRTSEKQRSITVYQLLQAVIQENAPFAASRDIEIRPVTGILNLKISVRKRDMVRALSQLLRNAIKYNYKLLNYDVWVSIRCYQANQKMCIEFENWGYPITQDEITRGIIFRAGKRGTFAARSMQPGYGIGLADAKRVIEDHGGTIRVSSSPAKKGGNPNNYNQPFLTTVTVELPDSAKE